MLAVTVYVPMGIPVRVKWPLLSVVVAIPAALTWAPLYSRRPCRMIVPLMAPLLPIKGVRLGVGEIVDVPVAVGVSVGIPVAVGEAVLAFVAVGLGVVVLLAVGVGVGLRVAVGEAVGECVNVGVRVGVRVQVLVMVGVAVRVFVDVGVAVAVRVAVVTSEVRKRMAMSLFHLMPASTHDPSSPEEL